MADNKTKAGPADDQRINVHEDHEVRYWTKALDCSESELIAAVRTVGVMVEEVKRYLKR